MWWPAGLYTVTSSSCFSDWGSWEQAGGCLSTSSTVHWLLLYFHPLDCGATLKRFKPQWVFFFLPRIHTMYKRPSKPKQVPACLPGPNGKQVDEKSGFLICCIFLNYTSKSSPPPSHLCRRWSFTCLPPCGLRSTLAASVIISQRQHHWFAL